jgi:hypothetical protein
MQNNENFAGTPNELFPIIEHEGVHVVDSRLIADYLGLPHSSWFTNIILKHQNKIESMFGILHFENGVSGKVGHPQRYTLLTENQALFIATLSRNTEEVIAFKAKLVASFAVLRQDIAKLQEIWNEVREAREGRAEVQDDLAQIEKVLHLILTHQDRSMESMQKLAKENALLQEKQMRMQREVQTYKNETQALKEDVKVLKEGMKYLQQQQHKTEQLLYQTIEQVESLMKRFGIDAECFVYVLFSPLLGWHKIGWSETVGVRQNQLRTALKDLMFVLAIPTASRDAAITLERALHNHFEHCRQGGTEYFILTEDDLYYLETLRQANQRQLELRGV